MAVAIGEFEVAPAQAPAPSAPQRDIGGDQGQPDAAQKIQKAMRVEHERRRRLAAD
jgi:hypothetical protein